METVRSKFRDSLISRGLKLHLWSLGRTDRQSERDSLCVCVCVSEQPINRRRVSSRCCVFPAAMETELHLTVSYAGERERVMCQNAGQNTPACSCGSKVSQAQRDVSEQQTGSAVQWKHTHSAYTGDAFNLVHKKYHLSQQRFVQLKCKMWLRKNSFWYVQQIFNDIKATNQLQAALKPSVILPSSAETRTQGIFTGVTLI